MSKDEQRKRILAPHGQDGGFLETLVKIYNRFEPASEDEKDIITVNVTNEMTRYQLAEQILELV